MRLCGCTGLSNLCCLQYAISIKISCADSNNPQGKTVSFFAKIKLASTQENLSSGFENNKGADQAVHPHSLISAFVICLLETIISKLNTN